MSRPSRLVAGSLGDEADLACLKVLRQQRDAVTERTAAGLPAERAVEWLRVLAETWHTADVPEAKAELLHAIYERIVVASPEIVGVRLTPAAYAHGLALALPEKVAMARPTGVGRAGTYPGMGYVPIEGAAEWIRRSAQPR